MNTLRVAGRLLAAWMLCFSLFASAEQIAVPALTGHVVDLTGTLTGEQSAALEQKLGAFEARKGSQLAVLIVPSTGEESIEQYSIRVVEQWKLGRKKVDDGALVLLAKNDHIVRIEVGYGLEGALNDATSKRIISEIMVPYFQRGDFYGGLDAGVDRMSKVIDGEPLPPPVRQASYQRGSSGLLIPVIIAMTVVGAILRLVFGRLPGALLAGGGAAVLLWSLAGAIELALLAGLFAFLATLFGGFGRGGWYGGGWGGGGFGGGGFGGGGGYSGGGGDFGGGGASGRW